MKKVLFILLFFFGTNSFAQTLLQQLKSVNSEYEAEDFIARFPKLHGEILDINPGNDSLHLYKKLSLKKPGDVVSSKEKTYKILNDTTLISLRVNYIYLDGAKLTKNEIDSLRTLILKKYKNGVPFDSLAAKYNMDGNINFGDTGWFDPKLMIAEFSDAVLKHNTSEVFTVDEPIRSWFFVVKKTFEPKKIRQMKVLVLKNGG